MKSGFDEVLMHPTVRRLTGPFLVLAAFAVFWFLTHGQSFSSLSMRGYAEQVDHPAAPAQSGRVSEVLVQVGQHVKAGDIVARMDSRILEIQRQLARNALDEARAKLDAQEVIQTAVVARAELQVLRLRAAESRDRAQLDELSQQVARLDKLADQGLVNAKDVEQSRLLQAGLAASVAQLDTAAARRQAGLLTLESGPKDSLARRLAPFREDVKAKEIELKTAELALEEATIRASADGTVSTLLHRPGDVVPAGTEIVRIASARPGFIQLWIPERQAGQLAPGREAVVRGIHAFDRSFGARVVEISPEIEEVPVRARVSSNVPAWGRRVVLQSWPDRELVPGEALHVRL